MVPGGVEGISRPGCGCPEDTRIPVWRYYYPPAGVGAAVASTVPPLLAQGWAVSRVR